MSDPIEDLIQEHLAGRLDAEGVGRLETWLKADRANRERYVRAARFAADLRQLANDRVSRQHAGVPSARIVRPRPPRHLRMNWTPWLVAASLLIAVGGWLVYRPAAAPTARGEVVATVVAGSVRAADGREVTVAGEIDLRMRLTVTRAATLRWADGSEVDLVVGSRAIVVGDGVTLDDGVATASVVKRAADAPFILDSVQARVVVVGTRFRVVADTISTAVSVSEGIVRVRDRVGGEVQVSAGQNVVARATGIDPRTLSVAPTGQAVSGAYASLQAAIDVARPGDTVQLLPGRHLGTSGIQQVVDIRRSGRADAPLIIRGHPQAEIVSSQWHGIQLVGASWIRLESLRLRAATDATVPGNGIALTEGCQHVVISQCAIQGFGGDGIAIGESGFIEITGNTIDGCGGTSDFGSGGISITQPKVLAAGRGPLIAITGNRLTGARTTRKNRHGDGWTGGNGIAINGTNTEPAGSATNRIRIFGNLIAGNAGSAVFANRVSGIDIEDNTCHRNGRLAEHVGTEVQINGKDCRLMRNLLVPSPGRKSVTLSAANVVSERRGNRIWGGTDAPASERENTSPFTSAVSDESQRADFTLRAGLGAGAQP